MVSAAAELNPLDSQHKLVLARIEEEEAHAAAEAERQRVARQRAKAVAPILERAREAEARQDYERAAWTAENALAVDPDCVEAKEILRRARAELAANPRLAEETVDLSDGTGSQTDPDDTVSLMRPATVWERVGDVFKKWMHRPAQEKRQQVGSEHAKT